MHRLRLTTHIFLEMMIARFSFLSFEVPTGQNNWIIVSVYRYFNICLRIKVFQLT